jgi:DNA-binding MarR family transcriptional regulator
MSSAPSRKATLASQAWTLMFDILMASSGTRSRSLASRGLTPNDARALWSLSADEGRPIGQLARDWECDASNATFIVGRLEDAGLARRYENPTDRRIKLVELTAKGARMKTELMAEYRVPPPEIQKLNEADLRTLVEVLEKMHAPARQAGKSDR